MILFQLPLVLGDQTTSPEFLSDLFFNFLKVMFVLAGMLYVAFAIIVLRQIRVMEDSLVTTLAPVLRLLGWAHFAVSVAVLAYFVLVL